MTTTSRIKYTVLTISACLILLLLISHKLWIPFNREFPLVPAFHFFSPGFGTTIDMIFCLLILACLIILCIRPFYKSAIVFLVCLFALLVIEDIPRLQPWVYIFSLMLLSIVALKGEQKEKLILIAFRLILAATYAWSGFQKLNVAFTEEIFPWLMSPFGLGDFFSTHRQFAYFVGVTELSAGIALLTKRGQKTGLILICLIHLFLLVSIGPFGNNWNKVIWPWNIAMIIIAVLSIPLKEPFSFKMLWSEVRNLWWCRLIVLFSFILPLLSYFNLWDNHLSGSLYSGNNPEAIFHYKESERQRLPPSTVNFQYYNDSSAEEFILIDQWCIDELEAPFYPQERYFKSVGRHLCNCISDTSGAGIKITVKEKFLSRQSLKVFSCGELLKRE